MKKQLLFSTILVRRSLIIGGAFFLSTFAFAQIQWQKISNYLPDYPYDTTIINNGEDTIVPILYDIFFIDNQEAWIATFHSWDDSAAILHTTDGCRTFEVQMAIRPVRAIYMLDKNTGYSGGKSCVLNKTTDGGKHWEFHAILGCNQIADIDFPPGSEIGYCGCAPEKVARIKPDGIEIVPTESPAGLNLTTISFPFADEGWLGAEQHIMHYLEDSNMFIHDQSYNPSDHKSHLFFLDGTHMGWCASGGKVLRTEDGMSWQGFPLPVCLENTNMNDVFFLNENIGWAVGWHGGIAKTTDGGFTWVRQAEGLTNKHLTSVFAVDENHVYVTGVENTLLMYGEPLGIAEFDAGFDFQIYPNPAKDYLSLQSAIFSRQSLVVVIYDLNGKKLLEKQIPAGTETFKLDVHHLKNGVYFCKISTQDHSLTKKIIIKK